MKKAVLMVMVMGALGFVGSASAASAASNVFTWSGSVPDSSSQNGFIIKDSNGADVKNGTLVFTTDMAGKGVLLSSSALDFNVFKYTGGVIGSEAASYSYQLSQLGATKAGLVQEQFGDGYYKVVADGVDMVKGAAAINKSSGGQTVLTIAPTSVASPNNQPNAGEDIAVQATIVITNAA